MQRGVLHSLYGKSYNGNIHRERRLSVDWKKIKAEYIRGGTSYRKLAEKYKVPLSTLKRIAHDEDWVALRDQCSAKAATKIVEIESDRQAERMNRLLTVSDKLLEAVEDAVDKFQAGELLLEKSALKSLSGAIKDIKEIQHIKSQLDIEEQKARIAILKKQAEADTVTDTSVKVQFVGELDKYSE
jgi:transposase-like protein